MIQNPLHSRPICCTLVHLLAVFEAVAGPVVACRVLMFKGLFGAPDWIRTNGL